MTEENKDYARIEKAIRYIEQNITEQPTLEQVAEHLNLSQFHFQKLFKRWAGVSPKRFLQYLTVENAKRVINESSILDTTLDLGLSSPSRLHDLFVSVEAVTPGGEYKSMGGENLQIRYSFQPTPYGECLIGITDRGGICHLSFIQEEDFDTEFNRLNNSWNNAELTCDDETGKGAVEQIFSREKK